jgi:biopolymer transport protein ExbB
MIDFLSKGGILVIPIALCSVIALAIFLERIIRFSRLRIHTDGFIEKIGIHIQNKEPDAAAQLAGGTPTPLGRVIVQALEVHSGDRETLEAVMSNASAQEIRDLSRYTQALATIGNIAPLLGLLGTVLGMIKAFMVIQQMGGKVNAAVLAGGIWEAMLTTALGLAVALPTMVAHNYIMSRVDRYEAQLYDGAVRFLKHLPPHRRT